MARDRVESPTWTRVKRSSNHCSASSKIEPPAGCSNPFAGFNPYTDTPKQYHVGDDPNQVYNYMLDPTYGKPTNKDAYQLPQTYRFAVGLRF